LQVLQDPAAADQTCTLRQNRAEAAIGDVKKRWHNKMQSKGVPKRLWDYGLVWVSEITNRMARGSDARTP